MSTVIVTVLVEGSICAAGGTRYLARSVNASVGGVGKDRAYPASAAVLLPWQWNVGWPKALYKTLRPAVPAAGWQSGLEAWVTARLEGSETDRRQLNALWDSNLGGVPEETSIPNESDPAWEDAQSWVMLQMQLARMDARVSHGLNLCQVIQLEPGDSPDQTWLEIDTIEIGGRSFKRRSDAKTWLSQLGAAQGYFLGDETGDIAFNIITDTKVEDLATIVDSVPGVRSPIEWMTRRVDFNLADAPDGDWLADAEEKIEALCDPVLALLDIGDATTRPKRAAQGPLEVNADLLANGLRDIILSSPDAILLSLLAMDTSVDTSPNASPDGQVKKWQDASKWLEQLKSGNHLKPAFDKLKAQLAYPDPENPTGLTPYDFALSENRERLRAYWVPSQVEGREDFAADLLDGLISAGGEVIAGVRTWLATEEASELLMGRLIPAAVAKLKVLQALAKNATGSATDRKQFEAALGEAYTKGLGDLLQSANETPVVPELSSEQITRIFKRSASGGDLGARDGITVPVDAIFASALEFDPHEVLDGYLIAVRQVNNPQSGAWTAVTRGDVSCLGTPGGPLLVPNPPAIEQGAYLGGDTPLEGDTSVEGNTSVERRHVLVPFNGTSILPDALAAEVNPVLTYKSLNAGSELPALAYGGVYRVAVGYQALGGLLPDGFCDPEKPLDFALTLPVDEDRGPLECELPFMRTMVPGAPDLRADSGNPSKEAPPLASLWHAAEDGVRPLWKEAAETGDAIFEDARQKARTKYLAATGDSDAVGATLAFSASPPRLPKVPDGERPGADAVLRYWRKRDEQLGIPVAPLPDDTTKWVPDPAVVGMKLDGLNKPVDSNGGIRLRVYDPAMPASPIETRDFILGPEDSLACTVSAEGSGSAPAPNRFDIVCPPGQSRVLVLTSLVDEHFVLGKPLDQLEGKHSPRFRKDVLTVIEGLAEAGSVSLAVEVLPKRTHLPDAQQLWEALAAYREVDNSVVFALRASDANPGPWTNLSDIVRPAPFAFAGEITCEWQEWRWDGGPILASDLPANSFTDGLAIEQSKDAQFSAFEQSHFAQRGRSGAVSSTPMQVRSTPGTKPLPVVTRPGTANMGATYYRVRLDAKSRYANLVAALPFASTDQTVRSWRGVMAQTRRTDRLPTPQIAGLIPLGGRVRTTASPTQVQAGAFALVLDTPWYDTKTGAGLEAALECEVIWEKDGLPLYDAAAISPVPILFGRESGDEIRKYPSEKALELLEESKRRIPDVGVIGLTRDRGSTVAIYTGALAFFDALVDDVAVPADYTARLRCRAVRRIDDPLASEWSNALLVEFEPTILSDGLSAKIDAATGNVTIVAQAGAMGLLDRWHSIVLDRGEDPRFMRQGLCAMVFSETTNFIGEKALRVVGAADVSVDTTTPRLQVSTNIENSPSHIRIFETLQRAPSVLGGGTGVEQLSTLASQLLPVGKTGAFEPTRALMRVGPLIQIRP
jgi:hypothetical protein